MLVSLGVLFGFLANSFNLYSITVFKNVKIVTGLEMLLHAKQIFEKS